MAAGCGSQSPGHPSHPSAVNPSSALSPTPGLLFLPDRSSHPGLKTLGCLPTDCRIKSQTLSLACKTIIRMRVPIAERFLRAVHSYYSFIYFYVLTHIHVIHHPDLPTISPSSGPSHLELCIISLTVPGSLLKLGICIYCLLSLFLLSLLIQPSRLSLDVTSARQPSLNSPPPRLGQVSSCVFPQQPVLSVCPFSLPTRLWTA